jgi:hypothetical protein
MARGIGGSARRKLSSNLVARLEPLEPGKQVRVLVLLRTANRRSSSSRRQSKEERKAAIEKLQSSAERALGDVDRILAKHGGRRLSRKPDALGTISVKATRAGILALASSRSVKGIFENQEIHLVR